MIRPEGPPGVCWVGGGRRFAADEYSGETCAEFDDAPTWCDGTPHVDWRAAAYERAATRPCLHPMIAGARCLAPWSFREEGGVADARCQPSAPVAR